MARPLAAAPSTSPPPSLCSYKTQATPSFLPFGCRTHKLLRPSIKLTNPPSPLSLSAAVGEETSWVKDPYIYLSILLIVMRLLLIELLVLQAFIVVASRSPFFPTD
jgi:hypothetical protein